MNKHNLKPLGPTAPSTDTNGDMLSQLVIKVLLAQVPPDPNGSMHFNVDDSQERALTSGDTPDQLWTCRFSHSGNSSAASSPAQTPPSHISSCGTRSP